MAFEDDMTLLLNPLANSRVFWDGLPEMFSPDGGDFILLQIVGGRAGWYTDQEMPFYAHCRLQVECYSKRASQRNFLSRSVEATIAGAVFPSQPYGHFVTDNRSDLSLYMGRQDFGIWYPRL